LLANIKTRLNRFARDKHPRLIQTFVNYRCKMFCNIEFRMRVDVVENTLAYCGRLQKVGSTNATFYIRPVIKIIMLR
jgi:hypothetical protein